MNWLIKLFKKPKGPTMNEVVILDFAPLGTLQVFAVRGAEGIFWRDAQTMGGSWGPFPNIVACLNHYKQEIMKRKDAYLLSPVQTTTPNPGATKTNVISLAQYKYMKGKK